MEYTKQTNNSKSNLLYNDNMLPTSTQATLISQDYREQEESKAHDLLTLYEEMRKQREYMLSNNSDHSLDNLIESTDNHINILSTMLSIKNTPHNQSIGRKRILNNQPNTPQPHYRPYIPRDIHNNNQDDTTSPPLNEPISPQLPNTNNNVPNIDNNQSNSTIPNNTQLPNTNNNVPNIDNNSDSNTNNNTSSPTRNRTRLSSRGSPLQSGIATLARAIFSKIRGRHSIIDDGYRNRFHNRVVEISNCNPHNKLITNECNILRLLLLYITLHPHCRHCHTLSTIASERLEILTGLI